MQRKGERRRIGGLWRVMGFMCTHVNRTCLRLVCRCIMKYFGVKEGKETKYACQNLSTQHLFAELYCNVKFFCYSVFCYLNEYNIALAILMLDRPEFLRFLRFLRFTLVSCWILCLKSMWASSRHWSRWKRVAGVNSSTFVRFVFSAASSSTDSKKST